MIREFRFSSIKAFKTCPRSWWLSYHRNLVPLVEEENTASVGTLYHKALEAHYLGEDPLAVIPYGVKAADDPALYKTVRLVDAMVSGYLDWLKNTGADVGLTVTGVERQMRVPFGTIFGDEVFVTGKLDLEVTDSFGVPKIIDNKSVQNLDQANMLYLDDQGRTYSLLRRMEGNPARGFIHNQARRVLRTGSAHPPFYQRVEVNYNDTLLDAHEMHLRSVLHDMVRSAQAMEVDIPGLRSVGPDTHHIAVPPNPSRDCSWRCDFVQCCAMFDDGSDAEGYLTEFYTQRETA